MSDTTKSVTAAVLGAISGIGITVAAMRPSEPPLIETGSGCSEIRPGVTFCPSVGLDAGAK